MKNNVNVKFHDYVNEYRLGMASISSAELELAVETIKDQAFLGQYIFVGGNGGSAAISNHLCCDFNKSCKPLKAISLSSNTPLITAISNDLSYEESLSFQLDALMHPQDICILISSSGNSPNIIKAAEKVKEKGCGLIGMCGFDGGKLKEMADIVLHVHSHNYGVVEDCHQSLMHIISQTVNDYHSQQGL